MENSDGVEGDNETDGEDGQDGDHSVILIKDPFIALIGRSGYL